MSEPRGATVVGFPPSARLPQRGLRWLLLAAIVALLALDSAYTVGPEENGVVLRFGRYTGTPAEPGLNLKIPIIDRVVKVAVQRQHKEEFGFRTVRAGVRTEYATPGKALQEESNMLTGDLNAAVVEWAVQYRIVDPYLYLFRVKEVVRTLRAMSEAVMREVVGDRAVNEVLTVGRQEIADLAQQRLQALCDQYETGIKIEQVVLQNVNPPDPVKPAFNEVNQAQQEKEQKINAAQAEYNEAVPRARGEAEQLIRQAQGYAIDRVNRAKGEAARFTSLYEEYRSAPEVTRQRLYLETMSDILPKAGRKVIVDDDVRGLVPLLNLEGAARAGGGG